MVYFCVIILFLFFFLQHSRTENAEIWKKTEDKDLKICCVILILLAALYDIPPGTDREGYLGTYNSMSDYHFSEIIENFELAPGYAFLSKAFSLSGLPFQFWLSFLEFLFLWSFLRLINKFSSDRIMALFMFFVCGIYVFSFHGLKQATAMALMWHAFADLMEKRYWRVVIFSIFAFYCHKSALVFLPAFAFWSLRNLKIYKLGIILSGIILIFFTTQTLSFLTFFLNDSHYNEYLGQDSGYSLTTFLFYLVLFCSGFFYKGKSGKTPESNFIIGMAALCAFMQLFALVAASAFRLGFYYVPFICIMLSNKLQKDNPCRIPLITFVSFFMLYVNRNIPYQFIWQ